MEQRDLFGVELFQTLVVSGLGVGVRHGREVFTVVRRIFQQLREQIPCLSVLLRIRRLASGLVGELHAQVGIGDFRSLQQNRNRLRIILGTPVEINRRTHHAQYLRIFAVECFDIFLGRLEVLASFVQAN